MENTMEVPQKVKLKLPCNPVISLLDIYPKEMKSGPPRGIWTPMLTAPLLTIAKIWKQPKCPLTDKCAKKMWDFIYIVI